jgi:molybdopterin-containing oxidoreductase family iron-sulfur binding subunit
VVNATINQIIKILIFIYVIKQKYWKSVEELDKIVLLLRRLEITNLLKKFLLMNFRNGDALSSSSTSRRDFLKYVGFSTAAATLAAKVL